MNGKMMAFGWTLTGIAVLAAFYGLLQLLVFTGSFKL